MGQPQLSHKDSLVLAAIRKHGDTDLATPRHTLLFFHPRKGALFGAKKALSRIAERTEAEGWRTARLNRGALIIECEAPVDEASVARRSDWAEQLAAEHGVEFDGWECAVNVAGAADD